MKQLLVLALLASAPVAALAQTAPTASPTPQVTIAPRPTPSPAPAKAKKSASPAPAATIQPEDNRVGITGVWEVQVQTADGVVYTHFKLTQSGNALTGQYLDEKGKKFPLSGSIDGKTVRVVVSMPGGTALVFSGTQDGNTDMVGTLTSAQNIVGFTAAYRPKYKWIDNIAPGTSGMGNGIP